MPRSASAKNMPWWSTELCALRTKARRAFKAWSQDKGELNRQSYRSCKSIYQRELRRAKNLTFDRLRKCASNNDTFAALSAFAGKNKTISLPESIIVNGVPVSDPATIVECCADHFFPGIRPSTAEHSKTEFLVDSVLSCPVVSAAPMVSEWEFDSAVQSLNSESSAGADGLSAELLLLCIPIIRTRLIAILNACLLLCFFPACWKSAKVSIIGKNNKASYDSLHSFRPISLGSNLAKILEKIILGRLSWAARIGDWFSEDQHGFRAGKSTETAAHSLSSFVESGFSNKCYSAAVFLDIRSAFDSAWHPAILAALSKRSCPLYLLKIVNSFLVDRCASLSHMGSSFVKKVDIGCPQGGVLSPFLWNVMIDDILRIKFPFPHKLIAYADDLVIITSHLDPSLAIAHLQRACDMVNSWLDGVKLTLNAAKSVLVLFSRRRIQLPSWSLVINGENIPCSQTVSYLGFFLDAQLSWMFHLTQKCAAAKRALFSVHNCLRLTWGVDRRRLIFLYESVVEPVLLYGCSVWISALRKKSAICKLRSFQRSITLLVTRAYKTAPTLSLLLLSNLRPVEARAFELSAVTSLSPSHAKCFSPSSRRVIKNRLPLIVSSPWTELISYPHLTSHPPWDINLCCLTVPVNGSVSLYSPHDRVLRFYVVALWENDILAFGVSCFSSDAQVWSSHGQFSSEYTLRRASDYALNLALRFSCEVNKAVPFGKSFEFFVLSPPYFSRPFRKLNVMELENLSLLTSVQTVSTVFSGLPSNSAGYLVAVSLAKKKTPCRIAADFYPVSNIRWKIKKCLDTNWEAEWLSSGLSGTKAFFPDVASASVIRTLDLKPWMVHIITGHCALNVHQNRFGFLNDSHCRCGDPMETVEHFLFHCPLFDRSDFKTQSILETSQWPPPLSAIPQSPALWAKLSSFIKKSKRLSLASLSRPR